ncbi:MAG: cellulase family glycosylhydrolase [Victivallales bacterium]|nr:cellulase family glycosylhydrolase [Victivallales bacterium]
MKRFLEIAILTMLSIGLVRAEDLLDKFELPSYAKRYMTEAGTVVEVTVAKSGDGKFHDYPLKLKLDTEPYRGKQVKIECEISAENVVKAPPGHLGIKCMPTFVLNGHKSYPEGNVRRGGTYDWRTVFVFLQVPEDDFEECVMNIGLQQAYGTVRYRKLTMTAVENAFRLAVPDGYQCEYSDAVRNFPRLRGVMSPGYKYPHTNMTEQDIHDLAGWGANFVRWQFFPSYLKIPEVRDPKRFGELVDKDLAHLDSLLPVFQKCGIYVLFDMHTVPGGRMQDGRLFPGSSELVKYGQGSSAFHLFYNKPFVECYLEQWRKIAKHYKDVPQVVGYDLMNEPDQNALVTYDFAQLQWMAAQEIRKIDPEKPIVFESNWLDSANAYVGQAPMMLKNIIYQVHMYTPGSFTHQGVGASKRTKPDGSPIAYPGRIDNADYDRAQLRKSLKPVIDFQKKYGARIYVGEFSAIRWAPGADKYLEDCISIFEELGWDWTYHAYREWSGWSVEHTEDFDNKKPATYETARKKALLNGFRLNRK